MRLALLALTATVFAAPVLADTPVTEWLRAVPAPPATAREAAQWLDSEGEIRHAEYIRVKAGVAGERLAAQERQLAANAALSGASFDPARMQDPQYAAQMQQKLMSMSPAQQQAFAMQQQEAMQKAMLGNLQAVAQETAAVARAAEAAQLYPQTRMARDNPGALARLQAIEELERRYAGAQAELSRELRDFGEGCDGPCTRQVEAHNQAVWQRKLRLADEEAQVWIELHEGERRRLAADLTSVQQHLAAADYGKAAKAPGHRHSLAMLHEYALSDVEDLLKLTARAAHHVGRVAREAPPSLR